MFESLFLFLTRNDSCSHCAI